MATSDPRNDDALGAALMANDKWLVTNLLSADRWATGSAADLLDGSAWHRFTTRLAALADRIQAAHTPTQPITRADGYRYLCMLLRNAFDVAIEDIDPDRPAFTWLTRRNKIGWDCPDALYANVSIRDNATYRITGHRGSVHFLGLQVMAGMRGLHNAHADEWTYASDGSFEILIGGEQQAGNWIPLPPGADTIWMRQFFYDWERERLASLWIDRIDSDPGSQPTGALDPGFFARRLDAVASNVEANVDLWLLTALALRDRCCNRFPEQAFGSSAIGAQKHQHAGTCYFKLADDEALLITVKPPVAKYWSFGVCNFWLESLDYANHQSSLNGCQAHLDRDGRFRAVVSAADPGIPNWLDTVAHREGSLIYRWNLADETPHPTTEVIPFSTIVDRIPRDTPRIDAHQRQASIESRRRGVRQRFARPL